MALTKCDSQWYNREKTSVGVAIVSIIYFLIMSKKAIVIGLFAAILASQAVGVDGASADVVMWPSLYCSPAAQSVASGEYVSFSAYNQNGSGQLSWTAVGGNPSYGYGPTFGTRFYTGSINETRLVSVTDGYQTSTCAVYVYNATPTPYYGSVSIDHSVSNSTRGGSGASVVAYNGDRLRFVTTITTGNQYAQDVHIRDWLPQYMTYLSGTTTVNGSWYQDGITTGAPSNSLALGNLTSNTTYTVSFDAILGGAPNTMLLNSVNVHARGFTDQNRTSTIVVNGSYVTPTPTVTPIPTARVELRSLGRNVTRGQSGENASVRARSGDTLDLIIRIHSTNGSYLSNTFVTDVLPAGLSYIPRSTTLNGYEVADGITSSGIFVGTLSPNSETVLKFSVRVDGAYVPSWGIITVNNSAQVRADGLAVMAVLFPITMGQNLNLATVSAVKTGPADSLWLALLASLLVTGTYAAYTRTDVFGRRTALAEVGRLSRTAGLNFSK